MSNVLIKLGYCPSFDKTQLTATHVQSTIADIDHDLSSEREYLATRKPLNIGTIDAVLVKLATDCIADLEQQKTEFIQLAVLFNLI